MSFWHPLACSVALLFVGSALAQSSASSAPASAASAPVAVISTVAPAVPADVTPTAAAVPGTVIVAYASLEPGDPAVGKAKAAVCGACHGMDGNSKIAMYPRLAGQSEHYIAAQLAMFKSGVRKSAIMAGFASVLSAQDMRDIGAWYASQTSTYGVADDALVAAGRSLYRQGDAEREIPACMACHGPAGLGNPGAPYPQLAGQHADYIQTTLQAWKDGAQWGTDANASIMPTIAQRLTNQDIAALASYIEGLHPAGAVEAAQ